MINIQMLNKYTNDEHTSKLILSDAQRSSKTVAELTELTAALDKSSTLDKLNLIEKKLTSLSTTLTQIDPAEKSSAITFYSRIVPLYVFIDTIYAEGSIHIEVYNLIEKEAKEQNCTTSELIRILSTKYQPELHTYHTLLLALIKKHSINVNKIILKSNENDAKEELISLGIDKTELKTLVGFNAISPYTTTLLALARLPQKNESADVIKISSHNERIYAKLIFVQNYGHTVADKMIEFSDKLKYKRKDLGYEHNT